MWHRRNLCPWYAMLLYSKDNVVWRAHSKQFINTLLTWSVYQMKVTFNVSLFVALWNQNLPKKVFALGNILKMIILSYYRLADFFYITTSWKCILPSPTCSKEGCKQDKTRVFWLKSFLELHDYDYVPEHPRILSWNFISPNCSKI